MRLTLYSDLAFRTLIFLAVAGERGGTIPEIATAYSVSEHHLRKVVARLIELDFVEATRGRGGGLRLAVAPSTISIGFAMRKLENDFALVECMGAAPERCAITECCGLQKILKEALNALFQVLDRYTLADAVGGSRKLERALGIDQPKSNARAVTG
jgi:Rrf2 family transcriptional regulator, nitric oxide-sensitive transcriptional repressor